VQAPGTHREMDASISPSCVDPPWEDGAVSDRGHQTHSGDLHEAARLMRDTLANFAAEDDSPRSAAVRRRIEGAIIATELAAGDQGPRLPD
jgi:hypothetical protein